MSEEQEKALVKAQKILQEAFGAALIVARATDENELSTFPVVWIGHLSDARGLVSIAAVRMDKRISENACLDN